MASPGKFYEATKAGLPAIINEIFYDLAEVYTKEASLIDKLGEGFNAPTDIQVTGGTATWVEPQGNQPGYIDWQIGEPKKIVDINEYPRTLYEELTYRVTLQDGHSAIDIDKYLTTNGDTTVTVNVGDGTTSTVQGISAG